jgi:tRNA (guanine37-N1)-methyltransferase
VRIDVLTSSRHVLGLSGREHLAARPDRRSIVSVRNIRDHAAIGDRYRWRRWRHGASRNRSAAVEAVAAGDAQPASSCCRHRGALTQALAETLAKEPWLLLLCRLRGVDDARALVDDGNPGDYVLTGGELAALVVIDAVARHVPGVLGDEHAAAHDSFAIGLLEGPHYTRPVVFRGHEAPAVLRSGHAGRIARWRREQALRRTWQRRPDLLLTAELDEADRRFLMTLALRCGANE